VKSRGRAILSALLAAEEETHAKLAKRVGIARSTVTALADGRRTPSLAHSIALRDRAGIPVDAWFQESSVQSVRLVASASGINTEGVEHEHLESARLDGSVHREESREHGERTRACEGGDRGQWR
jgi:transcriptional regulator with XRE-family HTH domain